MTEENEKYPSTVVEKKAVEYISNDALSTFADGETRLIYQHYYMRGYENSVYETIEQVTALKKLVAELTVIAEERLDDLNAIYHQTKDETVQNHGKKIDTLIRTAKQILNGR